MADHSVPTYYPLQNWGGCGGLVTHREPSSKTTVQAEWLTGYADRTAVFVGVFVDSYFGQNHFINATFPIVSPSPSVSPSSGPTPSGTQSPPPPSGTPSPSGAPPSQSGSGTGSGTPAASPSGSGTQSPSLPPSASGSSTASLAPPSASGAGTASPTASGTGTGTGTVTPTPSGAGTRVGAGSATPSASPPASAAATRSPTGTGTAFRGVPGTGSGTGTAPGPTGTGAQSPSPTGTPSTGAPASRTPSAWPPAATAGAGTAVATASAPSVSISGTQTAGPAGTSPGASTGSPSGSPATAVSGTREATSSPTGSLTLTPIGTPTPTRSGGVCTPAVTCGGHGACLADGACRCDPAWAGVGCDACAPAAYRNASGACTLPLAGVSAVLRAVLAAPAQAAAAMEGAGPAGLAARASFALDLQTDLRTALGLPSSPSSPSSSAGGAAPLRALQQQAGGAAVSLTVPPASIAVADASSGRVTANITLTAPANATSPSPASSSSSSSASSGSFPEVLARLVSILGAQRPSAPAPPLAASAVAWLLDGPATLAAFAADSDAGAAIMPAVGASAPSSYRFSIELGRGVTLAWAPSASGDRVHVRLACATGGAWCGVGVNGRASMQGATAVALEPGQPLGYQLGGWLLGGRGRGSIVAVALDAPSSPIDASRGTPVSVSLTSFTGGAVVATWAWPVGLLTGQLRLDAHVTLVAAVGRGGTLGPHAPDSSSAWSVHFGTGAVTRVAVDYDAKPAVVGHAVLMLLAWAALAPAALAMARLANVRPSLAPSALPWLPPAQWRWVLQLASQLCSVVGLAIVLASRSPAAPHIATAHEAVGLATFVLGLLQPLLAQAAAYLLSPQPAAPAKGAHDLVPLPRLLLAALPPAVGVTALLTGVAAVFLGIAQAAFVGQAGTTLTGLFAAYVAALALGFLGFEARERFLPRAPASSSALRGKDDFDVVKRHRTASARFAVGSLLAPSPADTSAAARLHSGEHLRQGAAPLTLRGSGAAQQRHDSVSTTFNPASVVPSFTHANPLSAAGAGSGGYRG